MPSILTTPPALEPVTLAEAKAHLRVTHADEDAYISTLIKTARLGVESLTGLGLITQGWSMFLDSWPESGVIKIPHAPVLDVTDIKTYADDNTATTINQAYYSEDRVSRPSRIVLRPAYTWAKPGRVANGIEVLLSVGFGATAASVPEPLREAVLQLIAHWYGARGDEPGPELPRMVSNLIQPYREVHL